MKCNLPLVNRQLDGTFALQNVSRLLSLVVMSQKHICFLLIFHTYGAWNNREAPLADSNNQQVSHEH